MDSQSKEELLNNREFQLRFVPKNKYDLRTNIEIYRFPSWERLDGQIKIERNLKQSIHDKPNREKKARNYLESKGFQVSNIKTTKEIDSHNSLVRSFFKDFDSDISKPPAGFPDFLCRYKESYQLFEVKSLKDGLHKSQLDMIFSLDYPTYIIFVSFDRRNEELHSFECDPCGLLVGDSESDKLIHQERCEFDYCKYCHGFFRDLSRHDCLQSP